MKFFAETPTMIIEVLVKIISKGTRMDVHLEFNEQISGPAESDENPFASTDRDPQRSAVFY